MFGWRASARGSLAARAGSLCVASRFWQEWIAASTLAPLSCSQHQLAGARRYTSRSALHGILLLRAVARGDQAVQCRVCLELFALLYI